MSAIEFLSPPSPVSMADEWFAIATADHFWMKWRHSVLLKLLNHAGFSPDNALEIGCGHGVARGMIERDLKIPVDGCDLNLRAVEMAGHGKGRLLVYNIFDKNPAMLEAYDLLLLMDVIEHIDSDLEFVQVSLQHLKPGGIIAINVPAHMSFFSRYDEVAGHKRRYNARTLKSLFRESRIRPIRIVEWGFLLIPILLARKLFLRRISNEHTIRAGFDPSNSIVNGLCESLRRLETSLPFSFPVGTSLLALGQKAAVEPRNE
jgi:SAM-dependent methyltransferase